MTPRPPTLRDKRRYLLVRVEPAGTLVDQKELYYAIADAVTALFGDVAAAVMIQAVVGAEGDYVFIRCRRGTERELAIALSTITACREIRIALRIVAASGTIQSLRERISKAEVTEPESVAPEEVTLDSRTFVPVYCNGQKIDVIEKGFKNTHRFFFAREDMESV
jgi:ribonuclease P/MRP protein subunit POP5